MKPVQLFCWHFMAYPYLEKEFDRKQGSGWVTVPNRLWDNHKARGLYQEYIDQLVYADEIGFDGMARSRKNCAAIRCCASVRAAALNRPIFTTGR